MSTALKREHYDFRFHLRHGEFRSLAREFRQRCREHPMALFFAIVILAFAAMALLPATGSAFASLGVAPHEPTVEGEARTTAKTFRLALSEIDIACSGQAWGSESADCLTVIARESGRRDLRSVRMIAQGERNTQTPNVF
jgi:hypothetical protein